MSDGQGASCILNGFVQAAPSIMASTLGNSHGFAAMGIALVTTVAVKSGGSASTIFWLVVPHPSMYSTRKQLFNSLPRNRGGFFMRYKIRHMRADIHCLFQILDSGKFLKKKE